MMVQCVTKDKLNIKLQSFALLLASHKRMSIFNLEGLPTTFEGSSNVSYNIT